MTNAAVFDYNKYIWHVLVEKNVVRPNDYYSDDLGLVIIPIVPVQEVPELPNHFDDKPYILYDTNSGPGRNTTNDAWWIESEEVTYTVFCPDLDKTWSILRAIRDASRKQDDSAKAIRAFLGSNTDFWFHTVTVDWVDVSESTRDEMGRIPAQIKVCYDYSLKSD